MRLIRGGVFSGVVICLVEEFVCGVGGVHDISAFQSPWIPRPRSFMPITSNVESPRDWKMSDFIPERQWDVGLLSSVFWPMDIEVILSIPFSRREVDDRLIWHYNPKGRYKVKSGYWLARELASD